MQYNVLLQRNTQTIEKGLKCLIMDSRRSLIC
jgi:hypothetical protein